MNTFSNCESYRIYSIATFNFLCPDIVNYVMLDNCISMWVYLCWSEGWWWWWLCWLRWARPCECCTYVRCCGVGCQSVVSMTVWCCHCGTSQCQRLDLVTSLVTPSSLCSDLQHLQRLQQIIYFIILLIALISPIFLNILGGTLWFGWQTLDTNTGTLD